MGHLLFQLFEENVSFCRWSTFGEPQGEALAPLGVFCMGRSGFCKVDADQHVVVGGEVVGVLDLDGLEQTSICAQDVIATGAVDSSFAVLPPCVE